MGWVTIERPWLNNEFRKSCIPPGRYWVEHRKSRKFGDHLHVTDVEGRSYILIHAANDWSHIVGCIGPGRRYGHGSGDRRLDVLTSGVSLGEIRARVPAGGIWMDVYAPTEDATSPRVVVDVDAPVTPARLRKGATGEAVEAVQLALRLTGHYEGVVDGDFGPVTDQAVRAFQEDRQLKVDGIAGPDTIDALGL